LITHSLIQGSSLWHEFRADHFGASEAAAMLGLSNNLSRNDLLLYKKTGKSKEYSDWVQKNILDYGHEVEALARAILENELNDELYPVTCSLGKLSASCDGLTIDGHIAFEHKQFNATLAEYIATNNTLPDSHMPQCQQILLVTGAQKVIFVCSDGTENNRVMIEVLPDQSWFDRIQSGWDQFVKDMETFEPKEFADKPQSAAIMQLPALSIQIKGEVTVSNLKQYKSAAEDLIAGVNTNLQTDDDFVNADAMVKFFDDAERKLEAAKEMALGQTASIEELMRDIDYIKDLFRAKRLTLDKLVKTQKEAIKNSIMQAGYKQCEKHTLELNNEFKLISFGNLQANSWSTLNFTNACKGKRTLESLHNAVDTEVAAIKIKLDDLARVIRKNLTHLPEDLSLFRDLQSIITKPEDDFKLLVESRLAEQKRKDEEAAQRAIADAKAREEAESARQAAAQERERIAALNAVQKSPEPVSQIEPQKPQNTVQEIAKQPTKLSEFDMWWFEIGKELFKQAGIVDGPARIAAKAVARAAWNYAASLKQDSAA
jgi:predicted phage-related endonuclease